MLPILVRMADSQDISQYVVMTIEFLAFCDDGAQDMECQLVADVVDPCPGVYVIGGADVGHIAHSFR